MSREDNNDPATQSGMDQLRESLRNRAACRDEQHALEREHELRLAFLQHVAPRAVTHLDSPGKQGFKLGVMFRSFMDGLATTHTQAQSDPRSRDDTPPPF